MVHIHIAIVVSRFNEFISKALLQACLKELKSSGLSDRAITTVWVPGSLEIPVTALKLAKKKSVDAVICFIPKSTKICAPIPSRQTKL